MNKKYLRPELVAWLVRRRFGLAFCGALLIALSLGPLHNIGFVSGLMLVLFGCCTSAFRNWRRERGLWMLALVALCAWLPLYVILQWDAIRHELNRPNSRLILLSLDMALATSIVWLQVRFLVTVVRFNRALFAQARPVC